MNAYGYDRVSTLKQVGNSSLRTQRDAIARHCELRGWKLRRIFTDPAKSAKNAERPGLQAAISAACTHGGVIVFYDLSRFARSIIDALDIAEQLKAHGAGFSSCTEAIDTTDTTPASALTFHVLAACAQFQRALIGHKVKEANARKIGELGYRTQGRQPIGWKIVNGRRVPCERERELVAHVRSLVDGKSLGKVARILEASGRPTIAAMRGQADEVGWTAKKVSNLVGCPIEAGTPAGGGTARLG